MSYYFDGAPTSPEAPRSPVKRLVDLLDAAGVTFDILRDLSWQPTREDYAALRDTAKTEIDRLRAALAAEKERREAAEARCAEALKERDENEQAHLAEELRALTENAALRASLSRCEEGLRAFPAFQIGQLRHLYANAAKGHYDGNLLSHAIAALESWNDAMRAALATQGGGTGGETPR